MAEPAAYNFDPKEIMTALLKHQGIHQGIWMFGVNFGIGVSNIGKTPDDPEMRPGFVCQVMSVSLTSAPAQVPGLTFDAAELNPKKK
ncbi:MAG: hypothetical protein KGJ32_14250 [Xanthomonadaceae bacterium]|nr:hypothetical protein [Xanthomonadaceae bacterium]